MAKYDINNLQKEVFDYLINKKDELKKQGIDFAFDLTDEIDEDYYPNVLRGDYFGHYLKDDPDNGSKLDMLLSDIFKFERTYIVLRIFENGTVDIIFMFNDEDKENKKEIIKHLKKIKIKDEYLFYEKSTWQANLDTFFSKDYIKLYNLFINKLGLKNDELEQNFLNNYKAIIQIRENYHSIHLTSFLIDDKPSFYSSSFAKANKSTIKHIKIENLPKNTNWIFLTGKNAFGKTTILQTLAYELGSIYENRNNKPDIYKNTLFIQHTLDIGFKEISNSYEGFKKYIVAYGPNRLLVTSQGAKDSNNIINIFPEGYEIPLKNYELEFSRWYFKQNLDDEFKQKYRKVKELMIKIIPNVIDIEITKYDKVLYTEIDENDSELDPLPLEKLAAGMKGIIAMVGDMILRLFDTQPHIYDPTELTGIVIIDEFDLHLHPDWQRKFPELLSTAFPKVQFIVSTHSPIPLLGAPKNTVILNVQRTKEEGITVRRLEKIEKELPNLLPNTLLTSPVFGLDSIKSVENKDIREVVIDENYNDREKYKALEKSIDDLFIKNNWEDNDLFKE